MAFVAMAIAFLLVLDGFLPMQPPLWIVGATSVIQLTAFALNGWVLARAIAKTEGTEKESALSVALETSATGRRS